MLIIIAVVVVVVSPQTPEDDPEMIQCARVGKRVSSSMDSPRSSLFAIRVGGGATESQVAVYLTFIIAYPARRFFRSVDQMLPAAKSRVISAAEASLMSHVRLGHLAVFSKNEV